MCGTGKYHSTCGNPITKDHTWYAPTDKWLLAKKFGIPKTKFKDKMISKKKEGETPGPGKA